MLADASPAGCIRIGIEQILVHRGRMTLQDVQAMVLDNRSYFGPMLLRSLDVVCAAAAPADIAPACSALRRWNGTAELDSIGYALAQTWLRELKKQRDIWSE